MADKKSKLEVVKDEEQPKKEMRKPTPEETADFKKQFDDAMENFAKKKWPVSDIGSFASNDVAMFLLEFLEKYCFWTKTGWMGVIKMEEELRKSMKEVTDETGLGLDYQALEFCGYMLMHPGGTGFKLAVEFEKQADKYAKIMKTVGEKVEEARAELKHAQYLQEQWAAAEQGFFLADLEPPAEEDNNPPEGLHETE